MDKIRNNGKTYQAPETSAMKAIDTNRVPVHWSDTNQGDIEVNQSMWDEEEPTSTYSFNLWDED
ncbi:MAG: hypothetical protein IKT00_14945 [Prevotella sp.]|nr:hypothetical protein [Prevotella sp.]